LNFSNFPLFQNSVTESVLRSRKPSQRHSYSRILATSFARSVQY